VRVATRATSVSRTRQNRSRPRLACARRPRSAARASGRDLGCHAGRIHVAEPLFSLPDPGKGTRWEEASGNTATQGSARVGERGFVVADRPQAFEPVELARARQHDVHDDVAEVDEHPFALAFTFDPYRRQAEAFGLAYD